MSNNDLNVKSCSMCGKLFKPRGYPFCQDCMDKIDADYIIVRDYLYKEPRAGIQELLEKTEVNEKRLFYMVRTGRITFAEGVDSGIKCESCGKPISTGTICKICQGRISGSLSGVAAEIAQKQQSAADLLKKNEIRMHNEGASKRR